MIGPGWLPIPRARARRMRTLAYTVRARPARPAPAPRPAAVNSQAMAYAAPRDLPVATLRRAPTLARLSRDLHCWLAGRYTWLRPRRVPMLVALLGMLATIQAVDYLAHPPAPALDGVNGARPAGRVMFKGGQPYLDGKPLGELPTATYRVRLVIGPSV